MRSFGRDHYKSVPESDLPDALIEIYRNSGTAALFAPYGAVAIQFSPWCGSRIGKDANALIAQDRNPFE